MPLSDIAISHPCSCFLNNRLPFSSDTHFRNKLVIGSNNRELASSFYWKKFRSSEKLGKNVSSGRVDVWRDGLTIKAVATLEMSSVTRKNERLKEYQNMMKMDSDSMRSNSPILELQSLNEESTEVNEKEKLRRTRISLANKGNTPWNKGRKHSPETLKRIKERTRLAMQDPKVKMKLVNLGHAQTDETKMKIGVGVRLGWERRREKLMVQETCHFEWQNLIAVSARKGLFGEEELQWDSYKILNKQHEREWVESVEQRRKAARPKGSKRAPKSAEQKRKISEAISAKWTDPVYRDRVWSGLAKFHNIPEGIQRKPKKKPSDSRETRKISSTNDINDNFAKGETSSQVQRMRSKRKGTSLYKDPLATSKLEMLKNIRAQRASSVKRKSEAVTKAKLMIAEAERAAQALETAAENSPLAMASLMESRMLIAEAIQFMELIENEESDFPEASTEPEKVGVTESIKVNGFSRNIEEEEEKDLSLKKIVMVNGKLSIGHEIYGTGFNGFVTEHSNLIKNKSDPKTIINGNGNYAEKPQQESSVTKKWVCGRLVEVAEET